MLSTYYCWRPVYDGYECLQLLEQNGGFGNNGAQPSMQIHNSHNNAGKLFFTFIFFLLLLLYDRVFGQCLLVYVFIVFSVNT